jgi:uncharacterized protein
MKTLNKIHKFHQGGDYFIVDPASGAVHIATQQAFNALELDKLPPDNGTEVELEIYKLYKSGLLFSEDTCQEYAETSIDAPLKAMCLHVSHDCNLRCEYCFAESSVKEREIMSPETAIAAIDFLVEHSGERVELEADFFGGEPTLSKAWETVMATVDYARSIEKKAGKHFRFTITTNGLLLDDEKIEYINNEMSNCVLSLDGRKSVNDRIRPTINGKGSFDLVLPKFKQLIKTRTKKDYTDCYIRGTFTAYNLDFAEDVIEMARLGFRDISIEPVTASPDLPYAIKSEHIPQIYAQYDRLYELIKSGELDVSFFHFNVDLSGGPCVIRRLRGCGCGNEYLAIAPGGDVYPCHRFVGDDKWNMADKLGLFSLSDKGREIKEYFTKTHIYSKPDCGDCWARFYCSGGCNASSYECFGDCRVTDAQSVECLMMKKRLECAIALSALKS